MHEEEDKRLDKASDDLRRGEADLERAEDLERGAREEIRRAEREIEAARHPEYVFFVGAERFVTPREELTGAEVKAIVGSWPAGDGLELEGEGDQPNRLIGDHDKVRLHRQQATHFIKVPPATFGA